MKLASAILLIAATLAGSCAMAQERAILGPVARVPGVPDEGWVGIDAAGFDPAAEIATLAVRRQPAPGPNGYRMTHIKARYDVLHDLPGTDGESVRTREVYVALMLDCARDTWHVSGAYGAYSGERERLLVPLQHTGLEATDVALARITRLACRQPELAHAE